MFQSLSIVDKRQAAHTFSLYFPFYFHSRTVPKYFMLLYYYGRVSLILLPAERVSHSIHYSVQTVGRISLYHK